MKQLLINPESALPGRNEAMPVEDHHFVSGAPIKPPFEEIQGDCEQVLLALGCFWGAERKFWQQEGVYTTAVGYAAGFTANPTYQEVCSGATGHAEVVLVVYQPSKTSLENLLKVFFEAHDPTQGMRQGNDIGTQYRSGVYVYKPEHLAIAERISEQYEQALAAAGKGNITTEIGMAGEFYYAETYHQQYLAKNPNGYCGLGGTGVSCAV